MCDRTRVRSTEIAKRHFRKDLGYGIKISKRGQSVFILRDGYRTIERYHRDFWEEYCPECGKVR